MHIVEKATDFWLLQKCFCHRYGVDNIHMKMQKGRFLAEIERGRFQPLVGFQVPWLVRLIREYYPACFTAASYVPLQPPPTADSAGRDVYPGSHRGEGKGSGEECDINSQELHTIKCQLFYSFLHLLIDGQLQM